MQITYDPNKNKLNVSSRGLSFTEVINFDFDTAWIWQDKRNPYPEVRWSALGFLNQRLHSLVFTETEEGIRVISFRKANKREVKRYEQRST